MPVKRLNLKTLEDVNKMSKQSSSKNQIIRYKEQGTIALKLLIETQNQDIHLNMKDLMSYPLTSMPFSLATGLYNILKLNLVITIHVIICEQYYI